MPNEKIASCYLLAGEDSWTKNKFIKQIKETLAMSEQDMMNYIEMKDKEVSLSSLSDFIETLPFFSEKKLAYIKDSSLLKPGKKDDSEKFESLIGALPNYIVLLIDEKEVDKRSKVYKFIKKQYEVIEFNYPGEETVLSVLMEQAQASKVKIELSILKYFLRNMPENMEYILGEFNKLISYVGERTVTKQDINKVCVFSLETRVFELVKMIAMHRSIEALQIYENMIQSKESPIGILVLIARQYRVILQVKYLSKNNLSQKEMAAKLKIPYFAIREIQEQGRIYTFKQLESILEDCLESDRDIKTGKMESVKRVEILIMKCLNS